MIQKAIVKTVTFHNPDNGYSVLRLTDAAGEKVFTAVGSFPKLSPGEMLDIEGEWTQHEKFGEQFKAKGYKLLAPDNLETMERYLGGGVLKGVGPKLAKKLVAKFGLETFSVLDNQPERLKAIPKLTANTRANLIAVWQENKSMREVLYFLQANQLSANMSNRLYKHYGADAVNVIKKNPYQLAEDVWGIGFLKADDIARKLGFGIDSYERIRAGLAYVLGKSAEEGHVFLLRDELLQKSQTLLACADEKIIFTLDGISDTEQVLHDGEGRYYLPYLFHCEKGIARRAAQLHFSPAKIPKKLITESIQLAEAAFGNGFEYSEQQREGIADAVGRGVYLLTGGPGTGKTTTVLGILQVFNRAGLKVKLAAPTGRAAKRLSEVTGHPAATIHRLLKFDPTQRRFSHDELTPLATDVLVVDELSMIDTVLMYSMLKAIKVGTRLILIGDPDQLPSVGPGQVLAELIRSAAIPHLHLDRIFRQAQESLIVANAHRIHQGNPPVTSPYIAMPAPAPAPSPQFMVQPSEPQSSEVPTANAFATSPESAQQRRMGNFHFIPVPDVNTGPKLVADLVAEELPQRFGFDPLIDIQVLTPMNQGPLGTIALNLALQQKLNPQSPEILFKEKRFRLRDKVMQLRNNYDKNIFNGDIGFVSVVSAATKSMTVDFEGDAIVYEGDELDQLTLAYAVTIHKSQGSEFKAVVMLMAKAHYIMLQRNLLYTGITRARERLFLVGDGSAIRKAVQNNPAINRNTLLSDALRETISKYAF